MQGPKWRSYALGTAIKVILPRPAAEGFAPWTPQRPGPIKNSLGNEFRRMTFVESELALLRDPRLAALATSPWPAVAVEHRCLADPLGECGRRGAVWRRRYARMRAAPLRHQQPGRRTNHPPRRHLAVGRPAAPRTLARFWAWLRPRAHLCLLAPRSDGRQSRGPDCGDRAGRTGAVARRPCPPPVRR